MPRESPQANASLSGDHDQDPFCLLEVETEVESEHAVPLVGVERAEDRMRALVGSTQGGQCGYHGEIIVNRLPEMTDLLGS